LIYASALAGLKHELDVGRRDFIIREILEIEFVSMLAVAFVARSTNESTCFVCDSLGTQHRKKSEFGFQRTDTGISLQTIQSTQSKSVGRVNGSLIMQSGNDAF
jgi:hypothetical protein